jgi:hypothetical protein
MRIFTDARGGEAGIVGLEEDNHSVKRGGNYPQYIWPWSPRNVMWYHFEQCLMVRSPCQTYKFCFSLTGWAYSMQRRASLRSLSLLRVLILPHKIDSQVSTCDRQWWNNERTFSSEKTRATKWLEETKCKCCSRALAQGKALLTNYVCPEVQWKMQQPLK